MWPWNKASICSLWPLQSAEFQNKQKLNFVKIKIPMRWWWQALQTWSEPQICFDWENMQSQALPVPSMHSNVISQFVTLSENFLQNIHGCFHKHKQQYNNNNNDNNNNNNCNHNNDYLRGYQTFDNTYKRTWKFEFNNFINRGDFRSVFSIRFQFQMWFHKGLIDTEQWALYGGLITIRRVTYISLKQPLLWLFMTISNLVECLDQWANGFQGIS
jgi:hypothetical protein